MKNLDGIEIGKRIRTRRRELDMTQADLADVVQVHITTISRYERGQMEDIKIPVIEAVARALKCEFKDLVPEQKPSGPDIRAIHMVPVADDNRFTLIISGIGSPEDGRILANQLINQRM